MVPHGGGVRVWDPPESPCRNLGPLVFLGGVPVREILFTGTVPLIKVLFTGTVPVEPTGQAVRVMVHTVELFPWSHHMLSFLRLA